MSGWASVGWRHPEWWSIVFSATAWWLLLTQPGPFAAWLAWHQHRLPTAPDGARAWLLEACSLMVMVVAMMVPLVLGSIRSTAARSLWYRRDRAISGFLAGYLGLWLMLGAAEVGVGSVVGWLCAWLPAPGLAAAGFAVAAAWQLTQVKQQALRSCQRVAPLAPRGWRADRDCLRYGWVIGGQCVLSCWALMLACVLAGHGVIAIACASSIGMYERYMAPPRARVAAGALLSISLVYATLALSTT